MRASSSAGCFADTSYRRLNDITPIGDPVNRSTKVGLRVQSVFQDQGRKGMYTPGKLTIKSPTWSGYAWIFSEAVSVSCKLGAPKFRRKPAIKMYCKRDGGQMEPAVRKATTHVQEGPGVLEGGVNRSWASSGCRCDPELDNMLTLISQGHLPCSASFDSIVSALGTSRES